MRGGGIIKERKKEKERERETATKRIGRVLLTDNRQIRDPKSKTHNDDNV